MFISTGKAVVSVCTSSEWWEYLSFFLSILLLLTFPHSLHLHLSVCIGFQSVAVFFLLPMCSLRLCVGWFMEIITRMNMLLIHFISLLLTLHNWNLSFLWAVAFPSHFVRLVHFLLTVSILFAIFPSFVRQLFDDLLHPLTSQSTSGHFETFNDFWILNDWISNILCTFILQLVISPLSLNMIEREKYYWTAYYYRYIALKQRILTLKHSQWLRLSILNKRNDGTHKTKLCCNKVGTFHSIFDAQVANPHTPCNEPNLGWTVPTSFIRKLI